MPIIRMDFVQSLKQHLAAFKLSLFLVHYLKNNKHHGQNENKHPLRGRPEDCICICFLNTSLGPLHCFWKMKSCCQVKMNSYTTSNYHITTKLIFPAFFKLNSKTAGSLTWHPGKGTCLSQVFYWKTLHPCYTAVSPA